MGRLRKFLGYSAADRRLLVGAFLWLVAIRAGLWLLPFPRLHRILKHRARASRIREAIDEAGVMRIGWAVGVASRYVPRANCLPQALTAQVLLARLGTPAHLYIGTTRNENGQFEAHAWLECRGCTVVGGLPAPSRYTPLPKTEWELL
jgi:hypothetical protein